MGCGHRKQTCGFKQLAVNCVLLDVVVYVKNFVLHFIPYIVPGRKILLIIGAVVMTLSLVSFGLYFQLISKASYHQATANVTAVMGTMENVTSTTASPANSSGSMLK